MNPSVILSDGDDPDLGGNLQWTISNDHRIGLADIEKVVSEVRRIYGREMPLSEKTKVEKP